MKKLTTASLLAAGLLGLAACGGKGDDKMGDNIAASYDNAADNLDAQADNLEDRADNLRDEGDRKEDAIDDSDINAKALNGQQQSAVANTM